MKAIGIVRRIDELGRVVIPKELRRTLKIKEGDPLEIFTGKDGELIFKKYSPINALEDFAAEYSDSLNEVSGHIVIITDNDTIVAVSGATRKDYLKRDISPALEQIIHERKNVIYNLEDNDKIIPVKNDDVVDYSCQIIIPVVAGGDNIGSVIMLSKKTSVSFGDAEFKLAKTASLFLAKQMET